MPHRTTATRCTLRNSNAIGQVIGQSALSSPSACGTLHVITHYKGVSMAVIVETRELTRRYGKTLALDHLNLEIPQGAIFGFIGPNGAGKTTTMRILTTLLAPTSGEAWVAGHSVLKAPLEVRKMVGFMPDFFGVYDNMKVW